MATLSTPAPAGLASKITAIQAEVEKVRGNGHDLPLEIIEALTTADVALQRAYLLAEYGTDD